MHHRLTRRCSRLASLAAELQGWATKINVFDPSHSMANRPFLDTPHLVGLSPFTDPRPERQQAPTRGLLRLRREASKA